MRKLVLWGHTVEEYQEMFDLSEHDLDKRVLEYGCGASAVNAQITAKSGRIVSVDPLFQLDKSALVSEVGQIFSGMVERIAQDAVQFDFSRYGGLEAFVSTRRAGMDVFFSDYAKGHESMRYQPMTTRLPFADFSFDLALSAHYLFAAFDNQDVASNLVAIQELTRVAKELRIFPLINRYGEPSPFLGPVLLALQQANYGVEVREVNYHLQPKGNAMLRVWAQQCPVG